MRAAKPSVTARHVAITRATLERPTIESGDVESEVRLYGTLGTTRLSLRSGETLRMENRTRFFDAESVRAIRNGTQQIVIVAAGYDGRALRFASPGVRWFEVDHPSTQSDKLRRLASVDIETKDIAFVPVDLTKDDLVAALGAVGHDRGRPTLFIVEGLLSYLSREVTENLLKNTRGLASDGSRLAVAFPVSPRNARTKERFALRMRGMVVSMVGEPWLVRYEADEPDSVLASCGWKVTSSDRPLSAGGRSDFVRYEGRRGVLIAAEPS